MWALGRVKFGRSALCPRFTQYHSSSCGVYGHIPATQSPSTIQGPKVKAKDNGRIRNPNLTRWITAYREHGHRAAHLNPLLSTTERSDDVLELDPERFGLDRSTSWSVADGLLATSGKTGDFNFEETLSLLKSTYASNIGLEFMYMENEVEREWFAHQAETLSQTVIGDEYRVQMAFGMLQCQNFDHFLANKFGNVKRYGGEGCETIIPFFMELFKSSCRTGIDHVIMAMAHRGRLNLLTGLLQFPPVRMFQKMKGLPEFPPEARASGDVLSHLSTSVDLKVEGESSPLHVTLLPNPSHLEAANPVAVGKARAKLKRLEDYDYSKNTSLNNEEAVPARVLCLQVHGDAALSGQGINQETLGFAYVPHFRVGGSLHLVINNQLGFTTPEDRGRSSRYASDIAKMIGAPVIHVNGDCPEDIVRATKLALDYRHKFGKDVFIDLICFRRWGHNELDDPTFTNPELYSRIHARQSIPDRFKDILVKEGLLSETKVQDFLQEENRKLNEDLSKVDTFVPPKSYLEHQWSSLSQSDEAVTTWDTGVEAPLLQYIGVKSVQVPDHFTVHSHLDKTYVKSRISKMHSGTGLDWATAEALAVGSLLYQGFGVRFSGEDVGRGTFSQRHAMLVDQKSGQMFIPLNSLVENQKEFLEVANTTLSEEAVLGFEYGYSLEHPSNLVVWEAQFGDFFNGAQIQIDTMVTSGELKWMLQSGMVLLLPHGMDGAGPEHSSCRIERFLQMTDSNESNNADGDHNNFQVLNPTTPAQYFHLLRRQMLRNFRKPAVVVAPKVLLRLSAATSSLQDLAPGTHFLPVIGDSSVNANEVRKIIFVSGKHFYNLKDKREELGRQKDTAIVRLESLCPFPTMELRNEISKFQNAQVFVWSQEEHRNMGAWSFVQPRFANFLGVQLKYAGRGHLGAPAVGVSKVHHQQSAQLFTDTFAL